MWTWIVENSQTIAAAANVAMLVVWALYFQLLLNSYRHQLRPKILINRGAGYRMNAKCVITNMSSETIYMEMVLLTLYTRDDKIVRSLSDLEISTTPEDGDRRAHWFQGPLGSGEFIDIGTFQELIERSVSIQEDDQEGDQEGDQKGPLQVLEIDHISILVAGSYTAQDGIIAADREFDVIVRDGHRMLRPRTLVARQIRSTRKRRALEHYIVNELDLAERSTDDHP